MPDINTHGEILAGRGRVFLDDQTVIGQVQNPDGKWRVSTWRYPNGQPTKVADQGCTAIAARAGHWRAWLNGDLFPSLPPVTDHPVGLLAELQSARGVAADDGTIALVLDFQRGQGLRLLAADGSVVDVGDAFPRADMACVVSRTEAFWMDHGVTPWVLNLPMPQLLPGPVYWPQVMQIHGEWWIAYHSTDALGVVLHPFDSVEGYQVASPPAFYLSARVLPAGVLLAWGTDPGDERVGSRLIDVTTEPRRLLTQPQPEPEPERPMQLPENVRATIRAIWPEVATLHAGTDTQRQQGTKIIVEQVVFSHPGQGYGWKSADPNRPPSKDAIARQVGLKLYGLDLVNGTTRELGDLSAPMEDITGQHFIPVAGVNHLGGGGGDPGDETGIRPGQKHAYVRDDNERDECDVRFTDGSQCDQPRAAEIHHVAPNPDPVPDPDPQPGDDVLRLILDELKKLSHHLGVR